MGDIKPIVNDHSGDWHMPRFEQFTKAKEDIGEPTPHMRVVDYMCRDVSDKERQWRAGCYLNAYSVITGEGIWSSIDHQNGLDNPDGVMKFMEDNWAGFHTRKPRRCVRTPRQHHMALMSYRRWMEDDLPRLLAVKEWESPQHEYDTWWKSVDKIMYFGRYVNIRLLELFRRWGYLKAHLYDIRAVGAHSPIRCMMLLRPDRVDELMTGDATLVNSIAKEIKASLETDQSYFMFATILCEYRAGYENRGDYAGNQHDEELEYSLSRYAKYWEEKGLKSKLYEARAAIDPHECLGEIQGWEKRRLDVASWLRDRGVVWSDLEYDYLKSVAADRPIARS